MLVRLGEVQHARLIERAPDELQADRQAIARKPARHGDRWAAGQMDMNPLFMGRRPLSQRDGLERWCLTDRWP